LVFFVFMRLVCLVVVFFSPPSLSARRPNHQPHFQLRRGHSLCRSFLLWFDHGPKLAGHAKSGQRKVKIAHYPKGLLVKNYVKFHNRSSQKVDSPILIFMIWYHYAKTSRHQYSWVGFQECSKAHDRYAASTEFQKDKSEIK